MSKQRGKRLDRVLRKYEMDRADARRDAHQTGRLLERAADLRDAALATEQAAGQTARAAADGIAGLDPVLYGFALDHLDSASATAAERGREHDRAAHLDTQAQSWLGETHQRCRVLERYQERLRQAAGVEDRRRTAEEDDAMWLARYGK